MSTGTNQFTKWATFFLTLAGRMFGSPSRSWAHHHSKHGHQQPGNPVRSLVLNSSITETRAALVLRSKTRLAAAGAMTTLTRYKPISIFNFAFKASAGVKGIGSVAAQVQTDIDVHGGSSARVN